MIDVNLLGLLYCTHAALPLMRDGGGGDIVNVSSVAGRAATWDRRLQHDQVGRHRLLGGAAPGGRCTGVRVTCVEPGFVDDRASGPQREPDGRRADREDAGDDRRVLEAEDIANAIVYILGQPKHVAINEILVRPTRQAR